MTQNLKKKMYLCKMLNIPPHNLNPKSEVKENVLIINRWFYEIMQEFEKFFTLFDDVFFTI